MYSIAIKCKVTFILLTCSLTSIASAIVIKLVRLIVTTLLNLTATHVRMTAPVQHGSTATLKPANVSVEKVTTE